MLRKALLVAALAVAMPTAINAQSVEQTLRNFGLFGTWATDCSRPAANNNFQTVYKSSGGRVLRTYYDGPGKIYSEYRITEAAQISSDQLRYQQEGTDSKRLRVEVIVKKVDNRILIWLSRNVDGGLFVKDGKYVEDGSAVAWQTLCHK
jgi:hypothetical protein